MNSKFLGAVAAFALVAGSSAAAAQTAQSLSLANAPAVQPAGAATTSSNELGSRGYGIYIIGAVIIGLLIWGAIELLDDDSDSP
jgi:hypothetical protein